MQWPLCSSRVLPEQQVNIHALPVSVFFVDLLPVKSLKYSGPLLECMNFRAKSLILAGMMKMKSHILRALSLLLILDDTNQYFQIYHCLYHGIEF
jgi:hypothetical protein